MASNSVCLFNVLSSPFHTFWWLAYVLWKNFAFPKRFYWHISRYHIILDNSPQISKGKWITIWYLRPRSFTDFCSNFPFVSPELFESFLYCCWATPPFFVSPSFAQIPVLPILFKHHICCYWPGSCFSALSLYKHVIPREVEEEGEAKEPLR